MRTTQRIAAAALAFILLPLAEAAELPRKAPEFTINLVGGKTLSVSQYKGRVVVMTFILTACSHCQMTVGLLNKMQNEYGARGLQVLASAINADAPALVPLFIKNFATPFPVGYNTGKAAGEFIQPTGKLPQMPLMAFIDRAGMIRAQTEGEEPFFANLEQNLRKQIEALLK